MPARAGTSSTFWAGSWTRPTCAPPTTAQPGGGQHAGVDQNAVLAISWTVFIFSPFFVLFSLGGPPRASRDVGGVPKTLFSAIGRDRLRSEANLSGTRNENAERCSGGALLPPAPGTWGRAGPKRCFGDFMSRFRFDFVLQQRRNEDKAKENEKQNENEKHCLGPALPGGLLL